MVGVLAVQTTTAATSPQLTLNYDGTLEVIVGSGTPIRTASAPGAVIAPGAYEVVVNNDVPDAQDVYHMFHLAGPGVNLQIDLLAGDNKTELYALTLQPNSTYVFQDDRQPNVAHVVFSTSGAGTSNSSSSGGSSASSSGSSSTGKTSNTAVVGSTIKSLAFRGALAGTLSSAGTLSLTRNGKGVSNLKSGRYKITVTDQTSKSGFTMQEIRKQPVALTGATFVGKHTVTVALKAGQWMFYTAAGKKHYFIVIS